MSEPTAGEVLGMLLEWREAQHAFLAEDDDNEDSLFVRLTVAERRLDKLNRAHLRTLANALTPPAPAEGERRVKAFKTACCQMSEELVNSRVWFEEAIERIGHLPDAPSRMASALLNMGFETADGMFLERYAAALKSEATP